MSIAKQVRYTYNNLVMEFLECSMLVMTIKRIQLKAGSHLVVATFKVQVLITAMFKKAGLVSHCLQTCSSNF